MENTGKLSPLGLKKSGEKHPESQRFKAVRCQNFVIQVHLCYNVLSKNVSLPFALVCQHTYVRTLHFHHDQIERRETTILIHIPWTFMATLDAIHSGV